MMGRICLRWKLEEAEILLSNKISFGVLDGDIVMVGIHIEVHTSKNLKEERLVFDIRKMAPVS